MSQKVVTRFAPSPTGYLHIGGARTALFNWLYAKNTGGKFLLRIEDTDRSRHNEDAVKAILDGLDWLDIAADEPPISQFSRQQRHVDIVEQLLDLKKAYRCYLTPEEVDEARDKALADKARFESPWREKTPDEYPEGKPFSVRFKAPKSGTTTMIDAVQGEVSIPNQSLDDMIILRSGEDDQSHGGPTYNLAVVVDDHDMAVTHVIRGDDHLINAARQQQIYTALDWPTPVWAHIPLIHGQDGKKLSKRHGALGVEAYRDMGFLPDGVANYLLRLGWAHADEEIISREQAINLFDLAGINKSPARLDIDKLNHVNGHYLQALGDSEFIERALPFLDDQAIIHQAALQRSAGFLKERISNFAQLSEAAAFITLQRPIEITGKAKKPLKKDSASETLREVIETLKVSPSWADADELDAVLQGIAEKKGVGFGQIGPPVRAALTAGHPSPTLGQVLYGLGREESLGRLDDCLKSLDEIMSS